MTFGQVGYASALGSRSDRFNAVPCDIIGNYTPTLKFGGQLFPVSESTFNLGPVHENSTDCIAGLTGMPGIGGTSAINEYHSVKLKH
jgi:cathepsin D